MLTEDYLSLKRYYSKNLLESAGVVTYLLYIRWFNQVSVTARYNDKPVEPKRHRYIKL